MVTVWEPLEYVLCAGSHPQAGHTCDVTGADRYLYFVLSATPKISSSANTANPSPENLKPNALEHSIIAYPRNAKHCFHPSYLLHLIRLALFRTIPVAAAVERTILESCGKGRIFGIVRVPPPLEPPKRKASGQVERRRRSERRESSHACGTPRQRESAAPPQGRLARDRCDYLIPW